MEQPPFDLARAHRWFAVELNNLAWDLAEAPGRSIEETERMIHAAHAACFHWIAVGNLLNHLRAQCLLATVYTKAGFAEAAVRHAERCLALNTEAAGAQTAFDEATAHGCAAAAFHLAGRAEDARAEQALACLAAEQFDEPGETDVFEKLFPPL